MKNIAAFLTTLLTLAFSLAAQENTPVPISRQIYYFSPLAQVYLNNLGLADRNGKWDYQKAVESDILKTEVNYGCG
jgi:hypothetical protein